MAEHGEDGPLDSTARSPAPGCGGTRGTGGAFASVRGGGQREVRRRRRRLQLQAERREASQVGVHGVEEVAGVVRLSG
jgi:hypothetical protein